MQHNIVLYILKLKVIACVALTLNVLVSYISHKHTVKNSTW